MTTLANLIEVRDEVLNAGYAARIDFDRGCVVVSCPGIRLVSGEQPQPCIHSVRVSTMRAATRLLSSMP